MGEKKENFLSWKDFEGREMKNGMHKFDVLLEVAAVAREKEEKLAAAAAAAAKNSCEREMTGGKEEDYSFKKAVVVNSDYLESKFPQLIPMSIPLKKRCFSNDSTTTSTSNKRPKYNVGPGHGESRRNELPESYQSRIRELKGHKINLVIEKQLTQTDLNKCEARLAIHVKQMLSDEFLTEEEEQLLSTKDGSRCRPMTVPLIEPLGLELRQISLKKWHKDKGGHLYALTTEWNDVRRRNQFKVNDVVQLWSFRSMLDDKLCLALVKL